ncbi:MAG: sigma-70 family RNA polymerase sigma factor, partial [Candidatus Omnitrophica bacterium]|nr:sigma-70 family RNA polymerase sigma factor [Candidatus Omnitrophota bacterium]
MTDLEFIQRCVKGDSLAWDEFFARYSRLIYNYIFQILNSQAPHVAKENCTADIFQEIFLLLTRDDYQKLKTFKAKNSCSLASWLRQVVVNFTIDYLRRQKLMVSLDEENDQGFSLKELLKDSRILVKEQISQEEILVTLAGCIEALAR